LKRVDLLHPRFVWLSVSNVWRGDPSVPAPFLFQQEN
jgi:hypothetical protein